MNSNSGLFLVVWALSHKFKATHFSLVPYLHHENRNVKFTPQFYSRQQNTTDRGDVTEVC